MSSGACLVTPSPQNIHAPPHLAYTVIIPLIPIFHHEAGPFKSTEICCFNSNMGTRKMLLHSVFYSRDSHKWFTQQQTYCHFYWLSAWTTTMMVTFFFFFFKKSTYCTSAKLRGRQGSPPTHQGSCSHPCPCHHWWSIQRSGSHHWWDHFQRSPIKLTGNDRNFINELPHPMFHALCFQGWLQAG